MYVDGVFGGVSVSGPRAERTVGRESGNVSVLLGYEDRETVPVFVLKPSFPHFNGMRFVIVNGGCMQYGTVVNFQNGRQIVFRGVADNGVHLIVLMWRQT